MLALLAFAELLFGQVQGPGNFELFRARISEPATSYKLEFVEGDVYRNPSTKVEEISGRLTVRQSQKRYHAFYQKSGFLLTQVPETVAIGGSTNLQLFVDCGRNDSQGWVRRDSAFVRLVDLDVASTNPTVLAIVEDVKRRENMVRCACYYGLPPMDVSAITWNGLQFFAPAVDGGVINGKITVDPTNSLVSGAAYARYDQQGKSIESGIVRYSYSDSIGASSMPDVIEKAVSQATDPLGAARNAFVIRIIEREGLQTVFDQQQFNPTGKANYMISNGIPLTRVAGRFVSKGELHKVRGPAQRGREENPASVSRPRGVVLLVLILSSVGILGWLVKRQRQNT